MLYCSVGQNVSTAWEIILLLLRRCMHCKHRGLATSCPSVRLSLRLSVKRVICVRLVYSWGHYLCHVTGSDHNQMHAFAGGRP